jgi:hypothetical protein
MKNYFFIMGLGVMLPLTVWADVTDALYKAKNEDGAINLFKNPKKQGEQEHRIMTAARALSQEVAAQDKGIFADHAKKIELALAQLFSTINSIRRHIKDTVPAQHHGDLDNPDAYDNRERNLQIYFASLNKKMIDDFCNKLKKAQSAMNGKFSLLAGIKYRNNPLYKELKDCADMADHLIRDFFQGPNNYPELIKLMSEPKGPGFFASRVLKKVAAERKANGLFVY